MNKNIIILGILLITLFSGCISSDGSTLTNNENAPDQVKSKHIIYAEELEVDMGKPWTYNFYKFINGNETCYISPSRSSGADVISCFKNN